MPEDAPGNPGAVRPDEQPAPQAAVYRKVREMQAKLHRWAGDDRSRRFGDLFNLVTDPEFLAEGWLRVKANVRWLRVSILLLVCEFVVARFVLDTEFLRAVSGILVGLSAAPFVKEAVEEIRETV